MTLLHNTAKAPPVLIDLLPRVPPLLERGSEHLRTTIYILQVGWIVMASEQYFTTQYSR